MNNTNKKNENAQRHLFPLQFAVLFYFFVPEV